MDRTPSLSCPMCGADMKLKTLNHTFAYICKDCQFVGLEYFINEDIDNLKMILDGEHDEPGEPSVW